LGSVVANEPNEPVVEEAEEDKDTKTAAKLLRVHDILSMTTKYDMCVACLPCLKNGKLEDAKFSCVNGDCPTCGFDKIWSKGLRNRILMKEYDVGKKEFIEKLNPNLSLATDIWLDKVDWCSYVYKEKPVVQAHLKEVAHQATTQRPPDADDGD